jgi:hypothetical protein
MEVFLDEDNAEDTSISEEVQTKALEFVALEISNYSKLISKSHSTYETKEALMNAVRLYGQNFGKSVTPAHLLMKINNMKTRFRNKTDIHKTE